MKKLIAILLACLMLAGCGTEEVPVVTEVQHQETQAPVEIEEILFESRFDGETVIRLTDEDLDVTGPNSMNVFRSKDIVYYEDREQYESGNPYGEGEAWERHSREEADRHTVVNITAPGTYRISGTLSAGQIRVDLGDDAYEDPNAVVELILDGADITCTVAPAILFRNVYECDGNWSTDTAKPDVDTASAGANLILVGENNITGSHVAKIFKDKDGEKKLWKQDGAIYSYMSMNVFGPGALNLTADNEGLDTELHLTINGGDILIRADNDGINTNEDGVSVTTINGGTLRILAGLGEEGDGIDSNGYLVINGGMVISSAKPVSDAGLDSDMGSFVHGGTVIALGSAMDWAESESGQVTMNLQFNTRQQGVIRITDQEGNEIFRFDPREDPALAEAARGYQGVILSCPGFRVGDSYHVYVDDVMMSYTGTDVMRGPGGMNFGGGQRPQGGQRPEGEVPNMPEGQEFPEGFEGMGNFGGFGGQWPEGEMPSMPEGQEFPEGFEGMGNFGGFGNFGGGTTGEASTVFYMQDRVNFFSGLSPAQ